MNYNNLVESYLSNIETSTNDKGAWIYKGNNESGKPTIVIDIDDTFINSTARIVDMVNMATGGSWSPHDVGVYGLAFAKDKMPVEEILQLYSKPEFFDEVKLNTGVAEFINEFENDVHFVFCSKGTNVNLRYKLTMLLRFFESRKLKDNFTFYGLKFTDSDYGTHKLDKTAFDLEGSIIAIGQ